MSARLDGVWTSQGHRMALCADTVAVRAENAVVFWSKGEATSFPVDPDGAVDEAVVAVLEQRGFVVNLQLVDQVARARREISDRLWQRASPIPWTGLVGDRRDLVGLSVGGRLPGPVRPDWTVESVADIDTPEPAGLLARLDRFAFPGRFDFAVCLRRLTFPVPSRRAAMAHLANVARSLRPGGCYAVRVDRLDLPLRADLVGDVREVVSGAVVAERFTAVSPQWLERAAKRIGLWERVEYLTDELEPVPPEAVAKAPHWIRLQRHTTETGASPT